MTRRPAGCALFPYTTLFRSRALHGEGGARAGGSGRAAAELPQPGPRRARARLEAHRVARGGPRAHLPLLRKGDRAMIDEELRAILACPACKGELLFEETRIICPACRKAYPIRDGIPVMLISEAEPWTPAK